MSDAQEIELRGRVFRRKDIELMAALVTDYWEEGRTKISEAICEALDWRQDNGWLKDRACRDVLRRLESMKLIKLPPSRSSSAATVQYSKWSAPEREEAQRTVISELDGPLRLVLAKGNRTEKKWNSLVQTHHYLGFKVSVGRTLKFLVRDDSNTLGAVSLADAAWAVGPRDDIFNELGIPRGATANNNRFLILPHVRIKYLASRILSLLVRDGTTYWRDYYSVDLKCLETFVDCERYKGTIYRAANWVLVGRTRGFQKSGASHRNSQSPKAVFLYPVSWRYRRRVEDLVAQEEE